MSRTSDTRANALLAVPRKLLDSYLTEAANQLAARREILGTRIRQAREERRWLQKGISGGKATGAVLTGGISVLATGLSRKEKGAQLHCGSCQVTWHI